MARVLLVVAEEEVRSEIARLLEGLGHEVLQSPGPPDCYRILADRRPQAFVVEESDALLSESLRLAPMLPVIVCLKKRDAETALQLLRRGAFECVAPPWTGEALSAPIRRAARVQGTAFGVSWSSGPPPRVRRLRAAAAAAAVTLIVVAPFALRARRRRLAELANRTLSQPLPYNHPAGAAWRDGLWASDWFDQTIYRHAADLSIAKLYHFPSATPGAFTFAEGSLLVSSGRRWLKVAPDVSLRKEGTFEPPGPRTVGLCYDGLYIWSADAETKRIYKHLPDDRLSVLESYPYPGRIPSAIACDASDFWSLDESSGELLRHDAKRPDLLLGRWLLPQYSSHVWRPTGLAHEGSVFWSVAEKKEGEGGRLFRDPDPWATP
jgi:DNA-binding response OmpR family regulator